MYDFYVYNEYYLCHFPNIIIMGGVKLSYKHRICRENA